MVNTGDVLRNLGGYSFSKATAKAIKTYPDKEVKEFISSLNDWWRLIVLLHLNCSMQTADIAELRQKMLFEDNGEMYHSPGYVDWEHSRLVRSRYKLRRLMHPPVSNYLLWPTTFELLQTFKSNDPQYVLVSRTGRKLKRGRTNDVVAEYKKLANDKKIPLAKMRSIGTTALGKSNETFKDMYLCNTPGGADRSVRKTHYDAGIIGEFDEAILALGRKFGQV